MCLWGGLKIFVMWGGLPFDGGGSPIFDSPELWCGFGRDYTSKYQLFSGG